MFVYMCKYSNTFLHMISRGIYRGLFKNRFLNLSLISRFPLYVHFPATVRVNRLSGAYSPPKQYPLQDCTLGRSI